MRFHTGLRTPLRRTRNGWKLPSTRFLPVSSGPPRDRCGAAIRRVDARRTAPVAYSAQARQVASLSFTHCAATASMLWFSRSTSPPRRPSSLASML